MRTVPVFGREMAAARAAQLIEEGGGGRSAPRRPHHSKRARAGRRPWLGAWLVSAASRVLDERLEVR
jgi:hypothetical protein